MEENRKKEKIELYIKKAESLISSGAYKETIEILNEVLEIDPKNIYALNYKGNILNHFGRYQEALGVCDKILEIDPKDVPVLNNKGNILKKLGKCQEALEIFDKALEIDPKDLGTQNNKKFALHDLGKYQEASKVCDKILEIDPKDLGTLNYKGFALIALSKYQEALEVLDKVLKIDPKNVTALNNKRAALNELGKDQELLKNKKTETLYSRSSSSESQQIKIQQKEYDFPEWVKILGYILFFGFFIVAPIIYSIWYEFSKPDFPPSCRNTTKEVQVIKKLDGDVTSVETETVEGCEWPDGSFLPNP